MSRTCASGVKESFIIFEFDEKGRQSLRWPRLNNNDSHQALQESHLVLVFLILSDDNHIPVFRKSLKRCEEQDTLLLKLLHQPACYEKDTHRIRRNPVFRWRFQLCKKHQ